MPSIKILNGLNMQQIGNTIDMSKGKSVEKIMDEFKTEIKKPVNPLWSKKINVTLTYAEWTSVLNFCDFPTPKPTHITDQIRKAIDEQTEKKENPELFADAEEDEPVIKAVPVEEQICEECNKPIEITGMVSVCVFGDKKCCGPCMLNFLEGKQNKCIVNKKPPTPPTPPTPVESDSSDEEEVEEQINKSEIWKKLVEDLKNYGITQASKSQNFALNRNLGKGHIYKIHTTKKSVIIRFFNDKHLTKEVGKNIFPKQN